MGGSRMIKLQNSLFTDILPPHLRTNGVKALAYAVGKQVTSLCTCADNLRSYAAIATAPDTVLDVLAVELRTPAYDASLPTKTKRELIADSVTFFSRLGTPAALERLVKTLFLSGRVVEWFDYSGEEYHFKVQIDTAADAIDAAKQAQIQVWANSYKNQRSVLDTIEYVDIGARAAAYASAAYLGCELADSCTAES